MPSLPSQPHPCFTPPTGSTPYYGQPVPFPHASIGLQNRIAVLETQLTHIQAEKAAIQDATRYLLETVAANSRTGTSHINRSDQELYLLKLHLALARKENHRLKAKLRNNVQSKASKFNTRQGMAKGVVIVDQRCKRSGSDGPSCADSPMGDLLGGAIPLSIIEQYPAVSSSSTDPSYDKSRPRSETSEDDWSSSESECDSVSPGKFLKNSPSSPKLQEGDRKDAANGVTPGPCLTENIPAEASSSSKLRLPYVQYFSSSSIETRAGSTRHAEERLKAGSNLQVFALLVSDQWQAILTYVATFQGPTSSPRHDQSSDLDTQAFVKATGQSATNENHTRQVSIPKLTASSGGPASVIIGPHVPRERCEQFVSPVPLSGSAWQSDSFTPSGSSADDRRAVCNHKNIVNPEKRATDSEWRRGDGIFTTLAERDNAISINRREAGAKDLAFPDLFRYGIRYDPHPTEQDVYRTVVIGDLPVAITLEALLQKVRGGSVISAKLCDTLSITGSYTALVTFIRESAASGYEDFAALHPVHFGGQVAKVSMLSTPTWPLTMRLRTAIFDHHHTRCLEVPNFPRHISPLSLRRDLRVCSSTEYDMIEHLAMRDDNVLELRFCSINAAGKAFGILTSYRTYSQCQVKFSSDPCDLPLKTMLDQEQPELPSDGYKGIVAIDNDVNADHFADDEGVNEEEDYFEVDQADCREQDDRNAAEVDHGISPLGLEDAGDDDTLKRSLLD